MEPEAMKSITPASSFGALLGDAPVVSGTRSGSERVMLQKE